MVISDEKVEALLETLQLTMEQMSVTQKENSDLHKQMITMLQESAGQRPMMNSNAIMNEETGVATSFRTPKPPFVVRPIIEEGVDDFGWSLFLDKWERFKLMSKLEANHEICLNLRESCSPEINRLLFQFIGKVDLDSVALTEDKLLE